MLIMFIASYQTIQLNSFAGSATAGWWNEQGASERVIRVLLLMLSMLNGLLQSFF
jgi:hypothetical protein